MLLPETKEREYRFKLALRMGLPIFGLVLALISHTFIIHYENLKLSFYLESTLLLTFIIYFIFYLIYNGFNTKITENVSKTFSREYLYKYLNKEILKEKEYTLILISIDNLQSINENYGIQNGDKVLFNIARFISDFFESKNVKNFPLGHVKGGDFLLGLKGDKQEYKILLELFCLKANEYKVDDIEVKISSAINDLSYSNELEYLIENLFEIQKQNRFIEQQEMNPSDLESLVLDAVNKRSFVVYTQDVFENDKSVIKECFVKLQTSENKLLYSKTYMKILKKLNLMFDFDLMVLQMIIAECNKSNEEVFAISLSPISLRNKSFLFKVKNLISENPNVKNRLMFIFCELEYYSNINSFNKTLQELRDIGIKIVIDRLGSLHTSFLYLRDLNIDIIRFDKYYTKEPKTMSDIGIINGYNSMAHSKSVKTWVKLLETQEIKEKMDTLGIDYMQGKYLSTLEKVKE